MDYAITISNLQKSYDITKVLKGINLHINKGETFALLGINGAGKTTLLECIEGLHKFEQGNIQVNGKCGVQLQNSAFPKTIKVKEALTYFAKWQNTTINPQQIEQLGITPLLNKQYQQLSTGQKRRLHLAISLLGNPDILILDEPTAGLDIDGRISMHNEIKKLKQLQKTIVLATHDMSEVQELCDRVAIIQNGNIIFLDTCQKLIENNEDLFTLHMTFSNIPTLSDINYEQKENVFTFKTKTLETTLQTITQQIIYQNITITSIQSETTNLNQRFLDIVKGN